MSASNGKGRFPGWEYIEEYAPAINLVLETYPGIETALMEAQRAYKEATEMPSSVVLREYPAEEEQLEYFVKKYGLQRRKTEATFDATTQIGRPRRPTETQAAHERRTQGSQTKLAESLEVSPPPTVGIHPRPSTPSLSTETQTPWKIHVDPSPPGSHSRSYHEEEGTMNPEGEFCERPSTRKQIVTRAARDTISARSENREAGQSQHEDPSVFRGDRTQGVLELWEGRTLFF